MTDEMLDVFDENGMLIRQEKRSVIHKKGLIHKTVVFFIFDRDGRVFVNQRTANKEFYPEYWSIVLGGHVTAGDIHDNAVIKEAHEEAGIKGVPSIFIKRFEKMHDKEDREIVKVYAFVVDDMPKLDPNEIKTGRFMTMEELEEKIKKEKFLPETDILYKILKEYKGKGR